MDKLSIISKAFSPQNLHPFFGTLFFVLVFVFLYHIPEYFDLGPYSMHKWRQSDSASIALAYYHNGMDFFAPRVMNVLGGDGAAVGEFPLYYYLAASLYHVFGVEDGIIRLLHWLTLVAGVYFFLKMTGRELGFYAVYAVSFFLASIGLFAFYGFNFLSDIPAFGWVLVAAYALHAFEQKKKLILYWTGISAFCLAGLLKPTILIPYFAWWGTWLFIIFFKKENSKYFASTRDMILGIGLVVGINAAWIIWSGHYNNSHDSGIFLSGIMPLWELGPIEKAYTWNLLWDSYLHRIVRRPSFWMLVVFLAVSMAVWKVFSVRWRIFSCLVVIGTAIYFILFFKQFRIHDYYLIASLWVFLVILISGLYLIQNHTSGYLRLGMQVLVLFILAANINMSYYFAKKLYSPGSVYQQEVPSCMLDRNATQRFIQKAGLSYHNNLVGVHPDPSPNITLYNLGLKGYNLGPNFKPKFIPQLVGLGVDHFITSDTAFIKQAQEEGYFGNPRDSLGQCLWMFELE